ncbi:hypothetical protein MTYM_01063 [Methylococcales bacterium]|nr:hypothetical protein MTYM_01063 [Methylococcales bacterium]
MKGRDKPDTHKSKPRQSQETATPLSVNEARQSLRVSRASLYKLINDGTLRTFKLGGRRFTTDRAIQDCIATLEQRTAQGG